MSSETEEAPQEIIVVRKYNIEGGGHHGGAWKIAYADFMTAMMALFLVLWLVNASDDETKAHVASYFNPVKLRDTVTGAKGLEKLAPGASKNVKGVKSEDTKPGKGGEEGNGDAAMLRDPYEALDELAAQAKVEAAVLGAIGDGEKWLTAVEGRQGGEAFKDPFDPSFWQDSLASSDDQRELKNAEAEQQDVSNDLMAGGKDKDGHESTEPAISPGSEKVVINTQILPTSHEKATADTEPVEDANQSVDAPVPAEKPTAGDIAAEKAQALKSDIEAAVADTNEIRPEIEVEGTKEGLLVRLTDNINFEMFSIASTSPSPHLVVFMEKISKVLASRPGQLVVMGHTDGRPFRSKSDNNWRLSAGRAQIAYHMLVRGGIDEKRFDRIEGHADRKLKIPDNPEASQNRRIEILLLEPGI